MPKYLVGILDLAAALTVDVALKPVKDFGALETDPVDDLPLDGHLGIGVAQPLLELLHPGIAPPERQSTSSLMYLLRSSASP
ncbi:MAG: hypothetical protein ACRDK7_04385 [Solirubrobacteraceae bacterium]